MQRKEFEHFAIRIRQSLLTRARSVVGDDDTAADVVQDCMLKLWTVRDTLDDYDSPEALAMTVTHRMALNHLRSRRGTVGITDDVMPGCEPSPEQTIISDERVKMMNNLLLTLPEQHQTLITMRHVDGMTNSEIAAVIGSTEGAVRTALSRARAKVAELFKCKSFS